MEHHAERACPTVRGCVSEILVPTRDWHGEGARSLREKAPGTWLKAPRGAMSLQALRGGVLGGEEPNDGGKVRDFPRSLKRPITSELS